MSGEIKKEARGAKLDLEDMKKVAGGEKDPDGLVCKYCGGDSYYYDRGVYCMG